MAIDFLWQIVTEIESEVFVGVPAMGTATGSPVSDVIANMVMEDVEQRALASLPVKPFFWKHYADDITSAVSGNKAECLLSHLNSAEPSTQFILECKNNRHMPSLD